MIKFNRILRGNEGYTLIELMLVVTIIAIILNIMSPRYDLIMVQANQAKSKNNLGIIRTSLSIYYSSNEGFWPLYELPEGDSGSLSQVLSPDFISNVPVPKVADRSLIYNGLPGNYDNMAKSLMDQDPPLDIYVLLGEPTDTGVPIPYIYDNRDGKIYINNDNYDSRGTEFYYW